MSENSKIEWTEATWNPVLGCSKISPGCKRCYAIRTAWRLQHNPNPKVKAAFEGLTILQGGEPNWTGKVRLVEERLSDPLHWREPRRIFVNSQSDLFHESLDYLQVGRVVEVMESADWHTYQVLTKRADRLRHFLESEYAAGNKTAPHIWWGVSVENPDYKFRIDMLREAPATVRFLSLEPLLADLGRLDLRGIHWVIVGGESGPKARPMHPDWVRSIRDQCKAAGVAFFFKQWGGWCPDSQLTEEEVETRKGAVEHEWIDASGYRATGIFSKAERVWKVGKKAAGRKLDGVEHSAYPQIQAAK